VTSIGGRKVKLLGELNRAKLNRVADSHRAISAPGGNPHGATERARLRNMPLILILVILLLLLGGGGYYMGPGLGYYGGGGLSLILLIVILFLLFGRGRGRL
jgi:hypothetical protein